ncbi:MAG: hypothetical protein C5S52_06925 [ANME-2 cluster archaeon]|nr:hypothetical protein [ANME-2 cluster archaeon]
MGVGLVKVVSAKLIPPNEPALFPCKRVRKIKKETPPPHRREDFHALQISFLIGWFGSSTVSPRSSAFSATMISIIAAAGVIIFAFSIGPYR